MERRMKTVYLLFHKAKPGSFRGHFFYQQFFQLWDFFGSGILGGISGMDFRRCTENTPAKMVAKKFCKDPRATPPTRKFTF